MNSRETGSRFGRGAAEAVRISDRFQKSHQYTTH
jgi:hypothetical protein